MNVSLLIKKYFFRLLPALLWLGLLTGIQAQGGLTFETHEIINGDSLTISFDHYHVSRRPEVKTSDLPSNGSIYFNPQSWSFRHGIPALSGGNPPTPSYNTVIYKPDPGFYGVDNFLVEYYVLPPNGNWPLEKVERYIEIVVRPSYLVVEDDFTTTSFGQAVNIDVLANDFSNASIISVEALPVTNFGTVVLNADTTLTFTPAPGFSGSAKFNYTACDNAGSCAVATVNVYVNEVNVPAYDSLHVFTKKNTAQVILLPLSGFNLTTPPTSGVLDSLNILEYIPDSNFVGNDYFVFEDVNLNKKVVSVEVLPAESPNVFVFDDYAFMPVDGGEVIIDVLANDKGGTNLSGPYLTQNANNGNVTYIGNGKYRYTPNAGFVGVDQFTYKASTAQGGTSEFGEGIIVVFDHEPELPVYNLITPTETPLVINYNIPIEDFDFLNFSSNLQYGSLNYYPGQQTVTTSYGQEVSGYNMVVYTPDANIVDETEEFEFEYCVLGNTNDCQEVKVIVDIINVSSTQDTLCAGKDCVWAGDANHDGIVDIRDILPIGLCMGEIGTSRPNAALEWFGQYGDDWNNPFAQMGMDVKHIDTDGDGKVQAIDTTAVSDFYFNRHTITPSPFVESTDSLLYIDDIEFDADTVEIGDVFIANINLGTPSQPAIDAYGVAFSLIYDEAIFDASVSFDNDQWLDYNSPMIGMTKQPFANRIDAGYTRTTGVSGSGYGIIGKVEFIIVDDINGFRPSDNKTTITLTPFGMMNSSGATTPIGGNSITLYLDTNEDEEEDDDDSLTFIPEEKLKVYPNPATDQVTVHLNGADNLMERVVVYTITGQEVYNSGNVQTKRMQVEVADLEPGMYVMKVWTNGGMMNQKVEVIR